MSPGARGCTPHRLCAVCLPQPAPGLALASSQVKRAKKCLDFSGTILFLHLIAVTCASGFPRSAAWCAAGSGREQRQHSWPGLAGWWAGCRSRCRCLQHCRCCACAWTPCRLQHGSPCRWVLHGTNVAVTALLGEWLCMQKELQEIPMASLRRARAATGGAGATTATAARANGGASSSSIGAVEGAANGGGGGGGAGGLALTSLTTRASTANIMELGRVDHTADRSLSKEWAPLSPMDASRAQPPTR